MTTEPKSGDEPRSHMAESEVRYRRLFEAAHDGILILDTGTRRITDVNPFLMNLLDYPRDHFIGKELWEIGIFRDKAANQNAMQELHEKGSVRFEDLPLEDRDGRRHPVEIVANVYQEGARSVIQCNIRDISERVRFEKGREALLAKEHAARMDAEVANRAKDLFLATLSHELRTPLSAILCWANILHRGKRTEADLNKGLEIIEHCSKAQFRLIDDVLDTSRIVAGKLRLDIGSHELVDIVEAAIGVVRPTADAKGISIETSLDPAAGAICCDQIRMQQVVWNLLENAIHFSPPGTTVRISLARKGAWARIGVIDEGQGISAGFLPYVFDRYRQSDDHIRRKPGGLGLGLSIVKHIVDAHGGTVRAHSEGEGRGASFRVNLPYRIAPIDEDHAADESEAAPAAELTPLRLDGLRVLVVEDETETRRMLVSVLGRAGGIVTAVRNAVDALAAVTTANPHMVVCDIAMPQHDGFDLIRKVRSAGHAAKDLPAVAVTGFAQKEDRLRALRSGYQVHVAKPIDPNELITVIATLEGRTG